MRILLATTMRRTSCRAPIIRFFSWSVKFCTVSEITYSRGSGFVQHVGGVHVLVEDTVDGRAEVGVVDVAGLVDAPVL